MPPLIPLPIPGPVSNTEEDWDAATAALDASVGEVPVEPDEEPSPSSFCLTPSWQTRLDSSNLDLNSANSTLCIPDAVGVPGKSGPPQWISGDDVDPKLDDPRWVGATQKLYPIHSSSAQAQFRALVKDDVLYLSFQALVDPAGTGVGQQDWVYLALTQNETSLAKIVGIKVNTDTISSNVQSGGDVTSTHYFQSSNPTSDWSANLEGAGWAQDVGVWLESSERWAINFKVNLPDLGITTPFRMWADIVVQATTAVPGYVTYAWPVGTTGAVSTNAGTPPPGLAGIPNAITNLDDWGTVHWGDGTICNSGISLACDQIGVVDGATLTHRISNALENDTFAARPSYNGLGSPAANRIAARFRIATWSPGDTIDWTDVDEYEGVQSNAMGHLEGTCNPEAALGGDPPPCPVVEADAPMHQCVLVTLSAGSVPGPQPITFLNDSLYYCACAEGHFGPTCDTCAPGYDDTTTPGICVPR